MSAVLDAPVVRTRVLKDCARKTRVLYSLPRPVAADDFEAVSDGEIHIEAFSAHVAGARDVFKFRVSPYSMCQGAVGECEIIATFGKLGADADPQDRRGFERFVEVAFGPIV